MPFMPQVPIGSNLHVSAPAIDPVAKLEGCDGGKSLKCLLPLSCSPSPPKVSAQGVNCPIRHGDSEAVTRGNTKPQSLIN